MLQQDHAEDFVIATGVQYSVRQFIEWTAEELGMHIRWEGKDVDEVGYAVIASEVALVIASEARQSTSPKAAIVRLAPRYFLPTEVETLLSDPTKAEQKLGWVPEIITQEMCAEMGA